MDVLTSNNAHAATSQKVKDILVLYLVPVNLITNIKTMPNTASGISKMSQLCPHLYWFPQQPLVTMSHV